MCSGKSAELGRVFLKDERNLASETDQSKGSGGGISQHAGIRQLTVKGGVSAEIVGVNTAP